MSSLDGITHWIGDLKNGDADAAQKLWERYFSLLTRLVDRKLPKHVRRAFNEEDIALSAFASFCEGVAEDRFPRLEDRNDLWNLLVVIASRKTNAYLKHHNRLKRGSGRVLGESAFSGSASGVRPVTLDEIIGADPTPEFAAEFAEEAQRLLHALDDDRLRAIALHKLQGCTVKEIAEEMGSTRRTVERRLQIIRRIWGVGVGPKNAGEGD